VLTGGLVAYLAYTVRASRADKAALAASGDAPAVDAAPKGIALAAVRVVAGLGMLFLGSGWLVDGAVALAAAAGLSDLVISLTVVALGTSLPEVATSVAAALKGQADMAVGSVIGSNLFNGLAVLGISALAAPDGLPVSQGAVSFDIPVMLALSVACLPIFVTGHRISRLEGLLFITYYAAFTAYALLRAMEHDALEPFSAVMLMFALPATGFGLLVSIVRAVQDRRRAAPG
jgi:cation:H+ antiporter